MLNCFHRSESPNGLEVYLHTLQLLTTIDEGIQSFGKCCNILSSAFVTSLQEIKVFTVVGDTRYMAMCFLQLPPMDPEKQYGTSSVTLCVRTCASQMIFQLSCKSRRAFWFRHFLCCTLFIDARTSGAAKGTQVSFVSTLWFSGLHILPQIQLWSLYDTSSEISLFNACGILNVDLASAL